MSEENAAVDAARNGELKEVVQGLKSILVNDLDIQVEMEQIEETTQLMEKGLALDSVVIAELITFVESEFDFQFDDTDMNTENFRDLRTLASLILSRKESHVASS